ncbi:type IV conjugative transfer system protein TraL [Sedimenticola hydrogenitrophicus]|jgi:conjugal transfer pilus assembly protein TraL|uniref:type IV conjugative transfer system protein TraL n=1 Tax=Sedimenticola hydrogenitrophicus TaxID=2967975 RepID=UPI0023AF50FE|nr:type IV conjugative transfer system protein TraL [Sedimenticola hydrogenitrophicus]
MDQERYLIPRRLDDPPQFFFWDADEAILVIFFTLMGALLGQILVGVVIGLLLSRGFARVKAEGGRGIIARFLYWYTPSAWWFRGRAPSHVREYVG